VNFLRRWGVYIFVGIFTLGSSGIGGIKISSMTALPAATLLPIFWAVQQAPWVVALVTTGYCMLGAIVCYGLRPLLWSTEWRDVECALPISRKERRHSDFTVMVIGLTPLFAIFAAGMTNWLINASASGASGAELLEAMAMLLFSMMTSIMAGMWMLQSMRGNGNLSNAQAILKLRKKARQGKLASTSVFAALVVLPLMRGPAKRAGHILLFVPLIAVANSVPIFWPAVTPWWLAAYALSILLMTTRLISVLQFDLAPLHATCAPLPVAERRLRLWRSAVAMIPITVTLPILLVALLGIASQLRSFVAVCFLTTALLGNLLHILGMSIAPGVETRATTRISVWLGILLFQIALASEVMK
jgi:hypothetical protein